MKIEFLQIEPTTRCNFTCGFCSGRHMRQGDLPFEAFVRIIETHPHLRHVELQGEGEPLMHARFFDMVDMCRARGIDVSLISNGSYFTPESVSRILETGIRTVSVSLESSDFGVFRQIRGGKLEKVVRGLELLMAERTKRGSSRPVVGFCVTVLKRTLGAIPGIVALYRRLGLDGGIAIQPLLTMSSYEGCYDQDMAAQILTREDLAAYYAAARRDESFVEIVKSSRKDNFYNDLERDWDPREGTCPWLENGGFVNIEGRVSGCCKIKDARHAFGNILTDSPEVLAAGRDVMRADLKRGLIPEACRGCSTAETAISPLGSKLHWARKQRERASQPPG